MALLITAEYQLQTTAECPNEAIFEKRSDAEEKGNHGRQPGAGDDIYVITHDRCCGHFDSSMFGGLPSITLYR